ncbi:hypothetical protein [Amycolatopsis sp. lyj-112]|uniref:hypothetical protein n=1 Tax=Amycolatopsis sp. lyj-112 TaxID=2789288 RepID=UPI00397B7BAA
MSEYYKSQGSKDGLNTVCKVCYQLQSKTREAEKAARTFKNKVSEYEADKLKEALEEALGELEAGWSPVRLDAYLVKLREDFRARQKERVKAAAAFRAS